MVITLVTMTFVSHGQQLRDTVLVYFPKEGGAYDADYKDNGARLDNFFERTRPFIHISKGSDYHIQAIGSASPEGQLLFNEIVSKRRMESVARVLRSHYGLSSPVLQCTTISEDWDFLVELIKQDPKVTSKDRILKVIEAAGKNEAFDDATIEELLKIEYSRPYWYIYHNIFPKVRAVRIVFSADIESFVDEVELEEEADSSDFVFDDIDFSDLQIDTLPTFTPIKKRHSLRKERKVREDRVSRESRTEKDKTSVEKVSKPDKVRKHRERKKSADRKEPSGKADKKAADESVTPVVLPEKPVTAVEDTAKTAEEKTEEKTAEKTIEQVDEKAAEDTVKPVEDKPATTEETAVKQVKKEQTREFIVPLTLKANTIGYALGAANIAAEVGISEHLSFSIPFYYSGIDYFKSTLKFRTCMIQPELRYNFTRIPGLYAGAHLGLGWFNVATDGDFRYQDAGGKSPAWGGGLGIGYRLPFKKSPNWGLEFAIGAGVYDVRYDIFYNEVNGPYYRRNIHDTWFGIDNASIAVTYRFDLKGRRAVK